MSDTKEPALDPCGCCEGIGVETPQPVENPPGLPAVRYRVGTHATFKASMLARLATAELLPDPLLGPVDSPAPAPDLRSGDDFQAALIDAFAMAADVLSFYQERIANESYLRTATERLSVLELAREIGYELKPGVAAAAPLDLIIEESPALPPNVKIASAALSPQLRGVPIASGTKVQSVPGAGETPQTFETVEDIVAFPEWNEIRPRLRTPLYAPAAGVVWTPGKADIKKGETFVIEAKNRVIVTVADVAYDDVADLTKVTIHTTAIAFPIGAVTVDGGHPYAFVAGSDGNLWLNWWNGSKWNWSNQGAPHGVQIESAMGVVALDGKRPYAFVKGSDGNLWVNWWSGSAWSWSNQGRPSQGASIVSSAGATLVDGNRPYVFVVGSDGNLWVNWWSGSAWNWSNQGTPSKNVEVVGASGITAIDGARPYLFVRGSDGNLWVNWWSGSAWTWTNQGTPADVDIVAGVGAIAVDNKRPYAFVIGSDGNLWVNWWNGSAWTWTNQGTPPNLRLVGEAGAIVVDGGRPYIFFTAGEGDLWVNWWSGSAWGWSDQGVPTFAALIPNTPVAKSGLTLEQLTAAKRSLSDPLVKASFESHAWNASDLRMLAQLQGWPLDDLAETIRRYAAAFAKSSLGFFNFALKAAPFGHNAPHFDVVQDGTTFKQQPSEFNAMTLGAQGLGLPGRVFLDNVYQDLSASSVAVFTRAASPDPRNSTQFQPELRRIHDVTAVRDATRTSLSLNGKVTSIDVAPSNDLADFYVRTTTILAGSKRFDATEAPVKETVEGTHLELDGVFVRLAVGQKIAIAGERADAPGVSVREVRVLTEVLVAGVTTKVTLDSPLVYSYLRSSVTFCANVAASTHGETVDEVLGNGDAGTPYQRFTLRQVPLTYVASESASGVDSTLRITVNDVIWKEVPTLFGHGPRERIYVTHRADNGAVTVQFGDGVTGARLPGGQGNVRARYRKGIGLEGLVGPDKLTLLLSRPLGLKSVTNPIAAADAADPEPRDEARTNAPLTVLTLDRVVSLSDYEDFVRGRAGVAKALATLMTGPEHRGVFVTVAGPNGNAISNTAAIEDALHLFGNRLVPLKVRAYREVFFRLTASVKVAPDHLPDVVQAAIETTLRDTFSFDKRAFGQPVYASEIIALIQDVDGVLSVNLTKLETDFQKVAPLLANVPEGDLHDANLGAELLALDPRPIALVVTQ